jgi:hypothetical protein
MTFDELDRRFPNGLDDAEITALTLDYEEHVATVKLRLRTNLPESPDRDVYARAVLTVREIYYVSIEPPDADRLFGPKRKRITVDGLPEDAHDFPLFEQIKPKLPTGAFCCRFFVHDWNSFIHIGAAGVDFALASPNANEMNTSRGDS